MDKKEIMEKIQFDRVQKKWFIRIMLIYIIIVVIGFFKMQNVVLLITLVAGGNLGIAFLFNLMSYKKFGEFGWCLNEIETYTQILEAAFSEKFAHFRIASDRGISEDVLLKLNLPFTKNYDEYIGRNYTVLFYENIEIEVGQVILEALKDIRTENEYERKAIFNGMFYICHMQKPFRSVTVNVTKKKKMSVSNPENLTKSMWQYLKAMADKVKCEWDLHFSENGNIYMVFHEAVLNDQTKSGKQAFDTIENEQNFIINLIHFAKQ